MRLTISAIYLVGLVGPAICQTSAPPAQAGVSEQVRIDSFQSFRREDSYGIASLDRKSTRLNSSHSSISYAVFCLKKKIQHLSASEQRHNESIYGLNSSC